MRRETPAHVLDYREPRPAGPRRSTRRADGCLVGAFVLYLLLNFACAAHAPGGPYPFGALFAFAIPLPLAFIAAAVSAHFLARPRLFDRSILIAVTLLLLAAGAANYYVLSEAANTVT